MSVLTINNLVAKGWVLVNVEQHPLGSQQGKALDSFKLLILLGGKNIIGARYFQIFLQDDSGEVSDQPFTIGLYNQGKYPGYNWIEVSRLSGRLSFGGGAQTHNTHELLGRLFVYLAELIPPGGHMMVEYDSPEQQDTARSLMMGIPPVATPLGYLLFLAGCGVSFKDMYFAESGSEGPRKLQGFKALDKKHAQQKAEETIRELRAFLDRMAGKNISELEKAACARARLVLSKLEVEKFR